MANLHALLIGVDYYAPNTLPSGICYPSLNGCVHDVNQVEAYLCDHLKIAQDNIEKLTASHGGDGSWEAPGDQSTYANMVSAFRKLRDRARAGDQVYIHYSGHGGRARTVLSEIKGASGFDEGLVPPDIGSANSQYLRDVEIAYLIGEILAKEVYLTVVFDSCHSGSATRGVEGKKAEPRGISVADETERPFESRVAPYDTLIDLAAPTAAGGHARRGPSGRDAVCQRLAAGAVGLYVSGRVPRPGIRAGIPLYGPRTQRYAHRLNAGHVAFCQVRLVLQDAL